MERISSLFDSDFNPIVDHNPLYIPPVGGRKPPLPTIDQPVEQSQLQELTISNLTYQYPNSDRGIFEIYLTLKQGSFTVVTGCIGSGKTTLLQVLLGLRPRQKGTIKWNNEIITNPATFFCPPRSAYTPQVPHLFSQTLQENILMGWEETTLEEAIYRDFSR